jgi:hypothetical protein
LPDAITVVLDNLRLYKPLAIFRIRFPRLATGNGGGVMMENFVNGTISITTLAAVAFGVVFLLLLLIFAFVIYLRSGEVPGVVSKILQAILALCAGAIGWIIGGELSTNFNLGIVSGNAVGGLALTVLFYFINPAGIIERQMNPAAPPGPPPQPVTEPRQRGAAATGSGNE